ncbi:MAG: hypothetical protein HY675_18335 [Chloroflexi bacterium]|nr:hypothetical protein [Chloroflexota bacterium]
MPFASKFDDVWKLLGEIENASSGTVLDWIRLDAVDRSAGRITPRLIEELEKAEICVADLTGLNPNVMWEFGYVQALRTETIVITQDELNTLPFDVKDYYAVRYDGQNLRELRLELCRSIDQTIDKVTEYRKLMGVVPMPVGEREALDAVIGTMGERFRSVKHELRISGMDVHRIIGDEALVVRQLLSRECSLKVMFVNPKRDDAVNAALMIESTRWGRRGQVEDSQRKRTFRDSLDRTKSMLDTLKSRYPDHVDYRMMPFCPPVGFFISDPEEEKGIVKFEVYIAKPPEISAPHIVFPPAFTGWRRFVCSLWDSQWVMSDSP